MVLRFDPLGRDERPAETRRTTPAAIPIDAAHEGDRVIIRFDVPGVTIDDLDVSMERNELTVTAERRPVEDRDMIIAERPHGVFRRQLLLGENLDADGLEASLDDGVLVVTIPVAERGGQRKVQIAHGGGSEGTGS